MLAGPRYAGEELFSAAIFVDDAFFNRSDMEARDRHTTAVVEPNYYAIADWIDTGVVRGGNGVSTAAGRDDRERFKRRRLEHLSHVGNHTTKVCNGAHGAKSLPPATRARSDD